MSELFESFFPEFDWQKSEIPPEGKMRIMEEGRAHLYGPNPASTRLLARQQARRPLIVSLLRRSREERIKADASIFTDCTDQSSCCSNACPLCRASLGMLLTSRILAAREHHPITRVWECLGGKFSRALHKDHYVDFSVIKKFCRNLTERTGASKPGIAWVDVRANLSYPRMLESAWWPQVEMFFIGVSPDEVKRWRPNKYTWEAALDVLDYNHEERPIMSGHPAAVDVELVKPEQNLKNGSYNWSRSKRLSDIAPKTSLMLFF